MQTLHYDIMLYILILSDTIDNLIATNKCFNMLGNNEYTWFCKYKYKYPDKTRKLLLWKDSYKYESCTKWNIYDVNGLKSWEVMDIDHNMIIPINKYPKDDEYIHPGLKIKGTKSSIVTECITDNIVTECITKDNFEKEPYKTLIGNEILNKDNFISRKQTPVVKNFKHINYINSNVCTKLKKKKLTLELINLAKKQGLILSAKNPYKIHYLYEIVNIWKNNKTLFYISKEYHIYGSIYTIIDALRDMNIDDTNIQNVVNNLVTYYNYFDPPHKDWIESELNTIYPEFSSLTFYYEISKLYIVKYIIFIVKFIFFIILGKKKMTFYKIKKM
jgi:hypothetical protein